MNENQEFKHFIRIIGRGQRAGRTLTQQEAFDAMTMVIEERVTPEQKGAFLMLLRVREETPEELAGFTQAFRQHTIAGLDSLHVDLDMGCYAGKRRQLPWFLLAVLVLAQQGKRIFLHGTNEPDSKRLYLNEVMPHLGFSVATSTQMVAEQLATLGFSYMELEQVNPQLDKIIQLRAQFGLRSCANTLARILNPSKANFSLQGVFHRQVDEKHRLTAALLEDPNMLCFRGEGGEIEFNPERDVALHICRNTEHKVINVEAFNESRMTKPRQLIASELIEFWEGKENTYAHDAVIGTLSIMLVLMEDLDWSEALNQAKALWSMRNKVWSATSLQKTVENPLFDTTGKHYAH
ncbi:glycosyl transferase family protein [Aliiglaciecola lipolytica]|uniref:glycosyl transferase family protein n=1 Tax=Aliiglaciecola lipolytica TaxID=477689 RepID=UPI001C09A42D|nr:glycosyl transferase family protein [Aliiglaciecola lipolytica]MBU2879402.1 glycosyl transferase family protein [Aliiglaciecola lipolytica]